MAWTHNLGEEFETRAVMQAALVLAPLVAVATASGLPIWLEAAIVSGSAFIVMEKAKRSDVEMERGTHRHARNLNEKLELLHPSLALGE